MDNIASQLASYLARAIVAMADLSALVLRKRLSTRFSVFFFLFFGSPHPRTPVRSPMKMKKKKETTKFEAFHGYQCTDKENTFLQNTDKCTYVSEKQSGFT